MTELTALEPYEDERGNRIVFAGTPLTSNVSIRFKGSNNTLIVDRKARLRRLKIFCDCDNARIEIGSTRAGIPRLAPTIRAGQDATVKIGRDVSMTAATFISATEGTTITIGDDVMFATGNEVRADDAHAIFDIDTGKRVNVSRSITIGPHVWLARDAVVLGGVTIGEGTVVGYRSLVTRSLPNNCIAVGSPATVIRRNVAWERPHLDSFPPYKPDASTVEKSAYWRATVDHGPDSPPQPPPPTPPVPGPAPVPPSPSKRRARRLRRVAGAVRRRWRARRGR